MTDLDAESHALHDAAPPGWAAHRRAARLPCAWDWPLMQARDGDDDIPHLAFTISDAGTLVGLGAARLPGLRVAGGTLAGVLDVDCLVSSALPGIEVGGGQEGYREALIALRRATRRRFGRRVSAVLLRQVPEALLSTATAFPSVVLTAPPIGRHPLDYASFDDYLATLSKSRRKEFRQIDRDPDLVITSTVRGDPRPNLDLDATLTIAHETVRRHHSSRWLPKRLVGRGVLTAAAHHDEVDIITYERRTGGLLSYGLVLGGGTWPVSLMAGSVRPAPDVRSGVWFPREILGAKHWIEAGVPGYLSGAGSDQAKVGLGHHMAPVWSVLHPLVGGDTPRFSPTARA
jgi:hypothetical protein